MTDRDLLAEEIEVVLPLVRRLLKSHPPTELKGEQA
jgi:hypothetical protein